MRNCWIPVSGSLCRLALFPINARSPVPQEFGHDARACRAETLVLVEGYVEHYNNVRLNTAIGYITPKGVLAGRQQGDPCQYWEPAGSTTSGDFQIQVKPPSPFRSAALAVIKPLHST